MNDVVALIAILILASIAGYEIISKVSTTLHTPLMSGANAISGIVLVGAIIVVGKATTIVGAVLGSLAIMLATINIVGGFMVTHRMLAMFSRDAGRKTISHG